MCHFITLVVGGTDQETVDTVLRKHGRRAVASGNHAVRSVLKNDEEQYLTRSNGCDCGTVLSSVGEKIPQNTEKRIAKLRHKGWSQAKIERWLADRQHMTTQRPSHDPDSRQLWIDIMTDLLALPAVHSAGILLHMYSGSIQDEAFSLRRIQRKRHDLEECLSRFEEDVLLIFGKR